MRVLFVTHNVPRYRGDAAGSFVLRLAVALQRSGVYVHIIAPGGAGLDEHDVLDGVAIERVRYAADEEMTLAYTGTMVEQVRHSWSKRVALLRLLRGMRTATHRALDRAARAGEPFDVVHAHWWFPAGLALWHGRATPRVITMHGSDVRLAQRIKPAQQLMRAVLGDCAERTAVSTWLAQSVQTIAPQLSVDVAPMPVDTDHFVPPPADTPRSGMLFVGRLNQQKGIADLLEALALPALRGTSLVIVGDGPDRPKLEQRATELAIADQLEWHGTLAPDELMRLYQRACVVAMPSREEGLGLVAVEAQLCGTPVVAYASGGLLDVVAPDAGGALVTPGDIAALATALALLVHSPTEVETRGRLARDRVVAHFSPSTAATRYRDIYTRAQTRGRTRKAPQ